MYLQKCVFLHGKLGGVKTMEQLKKRGYQMPSKCSLCKKAEEDLDHRLIHCLVVWGMWAALLSIPGFQWVCPYLLKEVLSGWS